MERLRQLRLQRELLQKDIAEYLDVDRTTYVKYETGDSEPDFKTLTKLADFFETTVDYLIGHTDDPTNYDRINTDEFNQDVWSYILDKNGYDMEKAIKAYYAFEKATDADAMKESAEMRLRDLEAFQQFNALSDEYKKQAGDYIKFLAQQQAQESSNAAYAPDYKIAAYGGDNVEKKTKKPRLT